MEKIIELKKEFSESPEGALLNSKVVSAFIGKSIAWLNWRASAGGGIPFVKLGSHRLYYKKDVLAWVESYGKKVTSTSQY